MSATRWRFRSGELILRRELTATDKARAADPRQLLSASEVLSTWSGLERTHDGRPGLHMIQIAMAVGAPEPQVWQRTDVAQRCIEEALAKGSLVALRDQRPDRPPEARRSEQPQQSPLDGKKTWLAVEVMDEHGAPVEGIEVLFLLGTADRRLVTDAHGHSKASGVERDRGTLRFADMRSLRRTLDARWAGEAKDDRVATPTDAVVLQVGTTGELPSVALQTEVTQRIVLEPAYRVRLFDLADNAMAGAHCRILFGGDDAAEVTSDDAGWIELPSARNCPAAAQLEWRADGSPVTFTNEIRLACNGDDSESVAAARLNNLGYCASDDLAIAVARFAADNSLADQQAPTNGGLTTRSRAAIARFWDDHRGDHGA